MTAKKLKAAPKAAPKEKAPRKPRVRDRVLDVLGVSPESHAPRADGCTRPAHWEQ